MSGIQSIRQWQWMILALLIGAGIGLVRQRAESDLAAQFGRSINGQRRFEEALLSTEQGRPWFDGLRVHKQQVPDGKGGLASAYVVSGNYFDGRHEQQAGKLIARYGPAFFLSDAAAPYKPVIGWDRVGHPDPRQRFEAIPKPTVIDYLDCLSDAGSVGYSRDWWVGRGVGTWMAFSFLVIGVLWPPCVNLLIHGSLRRPAEEKGVSLRNVRAHDTAPAPEPAALDLDPLHALEAELEQNLEDEPPRAIEPPPSPAPIRQLNAEAPAAAPVATAPEGPGFGRKEDDYYPTVLHGADDAPKPTDPRHAGKGS